MDLLQFTEQGIYCPQADVFIDPWKPVKHALVTHGHADHARWGHENYLCTQTAEPVIRHRIGEKAAIETVPFGQTTTINGVKFSFHPAGHIPGSAQIRVEHKGHVWVVSGDYKLMDDGFSEPFEPVSCNVFITESTFGLPIYKWKPQQEVFADIHRWRRQNQDEGKASVLCGYSLGKAQRLLANLDPSTGPIFTHGAIENVNELLREHGWQLPPTQKVTKDIDKKQFRQALILAPPSAIGSTWMNRFKPLSVAMASGWMTLRGARRRAVDRGFILSDHADWDGLNEAVLQSGAERVFVTHGYSNQFARWLTEQGLDAREVSTEYEGELAEINESKQEKQNS